MSKRKKKKSPAVVHRPTTPKELGLIAFRQSRYAEAIEHWGRLASNGDATARAALAEAHFRRALAARGNPQAVSADLERATELRPDDARFWYHRGLTLHRAGRLDEALSAYARAAELGHRRPGFGFVRGLAQIERDPPASLESLPWLSPEDRAALAPIAALLRHEPQAVLAAGTAPRLTWPGRADHAAALWQGLAGLMSGDPTRARAALAPPKGQPLPGKAEQVRAFYHGLASAAAGDPQAALAEWTAAARWGSRVHLLPFSRLNQAIARLQLQRLHELLAAGQWAQAFQQAQAALEVTPAEPALVQAALVAANRSAQAAAEAGDWTTAINHWQTMRSLLELPLALGPLPPVLRNLAIAYEASEQWDLAAESWAALLNKLPRRASKKKASRAAGIPVEAQRAWLRRRILEDYKRAGRPDEAIDHYKKAVKTDPDNLDLRLELASALLANEQSQAARNELKRILDRDPQHVGALLLQAEVQQDRGEWFAAEESLRRVVKIDPEQDTARRALAQMLIELGVNAYNSREYARARKIYAEALTLTPADPQLLVFLAETELRLKLREAAQAHYQAALDLARPEAYARVFESHVRGDDEAQARQVLKRAEAAGLAAFSFYLAAGVACLLHAAPPPSPGFLAPPRRPDKAEEKWTRWGHELLQKGLAAAPNRIEALHVILSDLSTHNPGAAVEYARQLVELEPGDPGVRTMLGTLQALTQDIVAAKATLKEAERLARKQGNRQMVEDIAEMRRQVSSPLFSMVAPLLSQLGPDFLDDEEFFYE